MTRGILPSLAALGLVLTGCTGDGGDTSATWPLSQGAQRPDVGDSTIRNMTLPAGVCSGAGGGWRNSVPITLHDGQGEATLPSGEFGGASVTKATLEGWIDADHVGTQDAVISFVCFGSPIKQCCAGRSSMLKFIGVFDFSSGVASPRQVGGTITPGSSRYIDAMRIADQAIVTDEKQIYPEHTSFAELGFSPDATVEVTHRFSDGEWTSSERVLG